MTSVNREFGWLKNDVRGESKSLQIYDSIANWTGNTLFSKIILSVFLYKKSPYDVSILLSYGYIYKHN